MSTLRPSLRSGLILALAVLMAPVTAAAASSFATPVAGLITTPSGRAAVTAPFILDGGRIYIEAEFRKPDGGTRKALVWVNFGVGRMSLSPALHQELGGGAVDFTVAGAPVRVEPDAIQEANAAAFAQMGPLPVEAVLPAGMWPLFRVTIDYPAKTLTLAPPSDLPGEGTAVPVKVNTRTGLASVRARVDGDDYPLVVDPGAGYTWIRGSDVRGWLKANPGWYRADGALGASNQAMFGENVEQLGTVVRVPEMRIGDLVLADVGVLGTAPAKGHPADKLKDALLWKLWGQGAAEPATGWIGANALRPYRITLDYRNGVSYWQRTGEPEAGELDAVGVALEHRTINYFIGAVVSRNGVPDVIGPKVGDKLVAVDGRPAAPMTRGEMMQALRGRPGERRKLSLERDGAPLEVEAVVRAEQPGG